MIAWPQHVMYTRDWSFFSLRWPHTQATTPAKGWVFSGVFLLCIVTFIAPDQNSA